MRKKMFKRIISIIICFSMSFGTLDSVPFVKEYVDNVKIVKAANGVSEKLNSLRSKFPQGSFWNHKVTAYSNNGDQLMARRDESFSNSVTYQTCATHTGTASVGSYDCNYFDGGIQCMGFAKKIFYEVFGQRESSSSLPRRYDRTNVSVGDYVRINNNGHSGVVLARSGNTIYLVECNLCGNIVGNTVQYPARKCMIAWGTIAYNINSITYFKHASNYDQINAGSGNNSNTNKFASIAVDKSNKYWHIDDYNIVPCAKVYNPKRLQITRCGIQIRDGNTVIASKEEMMNSNYQYATSANIWYNCISECGKTLRPGHTYTWNIYAYVGNKKVETGWQTIKTTGTEKPSKPTLSTSKSNYAVGDAATISWGADSNATGGYVITLTQTSGGTYTKTLSTSTYNATNLAFTLPSAGEYKVTGYARGSQNSDTATLNKTIVAHEPNVVKFVETFDDGTENVLSLQTVRYGYSATAPTGISRRGHTFLGWDGTYTNVTSARTIVAKFKRNTYKVVFYDKDGNELKTESVLFESAATPPEPPEAEQGYVFAGWDNEDYKNVQGNTEVKASYVWANDDLPVVITLNKCEFKDDGYIINYNIKNNPNERTKGRALVSLRTSKGKILDTTESNAFSLAKGEEKEGLEIFVPYEGTATQASLYIIDGFSTGIPISETATIDVERTWSDWSGEEPEEDNEIETRTEYRYKDKETTTTRTSINEGWTFDKSVLDSNWTYGSWSGWSRNAYSAYTNTLNKREVGTRTVQDSAAYTLYNWFYYRIPSPVSYTYSASYSASHGGTYYSWQTTYMLNWCKDVGNGWQGYTTPGGKNFANELWYLSGTQNVPAKTHTEWRYRDATKGYTYYWYKWKDWTDWSDAVVTANDSRQVETRTAYRYRAKMEDIEDNSGEQYTTTGTVDADLAGKQAILLVYKNDEPSDSNNEYIGQGVIGENGGFSFEYITREPISEKTGDYTILLAIEGASEPIYVDKIYAPKPKYTVTFKDNEGNIIDTQEIEEYKSATAPIAPEVEHYTFVGWDYGLTNIRDHMTITAQYIKNQYSVAFVNWDAREVETEIFEYEEPIHYPEESKIEGYDFVGWTTPSGETVDKIVDNTILIANYKIKTYIIRFYDVEGNEIHSEVVEYGKDATAPEAPVIDKMEFTSWSDYGFTQVKGDLDVYPLYQYIETTSNPTNDTESGVLEEACDIHLSAEEGATIYYTTDGTTPTVLSEVYADKITIDKNTFLQYVAVAPEKNASEVKTASYLLISSEDDEGALVIKKDTYNIDRDDTALLTFFLSHEEENIGVEFYSLDENIATIDEDGTIHANQVGTTRIFARTADSKYADYCDVVVTTDEIDAESIELSQNSIVGLKDSSTVLSATVYPENATDKTVDWYVDDNSVAEIDDKGNITIVGEGRTFITAYSKNGTCMAECIVEGVDNLENNKVYLSSQLLVLQVNDKTKLEAYYEDINTSCVWSSYNEDVASVDAMGTVKALKEGFSIIYATLEDGTELMCTVIVQNIDPMKDFEDSTPTDEPTATPPAAAEKNEEQKKEENKITAVAVKKVSSLKLVAKKKSFKAKWKKIAGAEGYQIQYSTNKKFKKKNTKVKNTKEKTVTIKKLKKKKTYYVRVRAYKLDGSVKIYGKWSKMKKVKIKK